MMPALGPGLKDEEENWRPAQWARENSIMKRPLLQTLTGGGGGLLAPCNFTRTYICLSKEKNGIPMKAFVMTSP